MCECECGKRKIICANSLKSGQTQSCGCLRNERIKEATYTVNNTSNNEVRYEGNIVHVRLSNSEKEMICYASDWEKLKNRTWRLTANGYAGVSKNKTEWLAHITKDGKWSLIGKYGTKNEAIKARKEKEIELYGINSQ